jgi:hypothetical protein
MIKQLEILFKSRKKIKDLEAENSKLNNRIRSFENQGNKLKALKEQVDQLEKLNVQLNTENKLLKNQISPIAPDVIPVEEVKSLLLSFHDLLKTQSGNENKVLGVPLQDCPVAIVKIIEVLSRRHKRSKYFTKAEKTINTLEYENTNLKRELRDLKKMINELENKNVRLFNSQNSFRAKTLLDDWLKNRPDSSFLDSGGSVSSSI